MSGARVRFTPEARGEIDNAFEWYLGRNLQTAEIFLQQVDDAIRLIGNAPAVWPHFEAGTRRYVLRKFPYSLIYREIPTGIEVVALAHHKRRPRYWRGRLRR